MKNYLNQYLKKSLGNMNYNTILPPQRIIVDGVAEYKKEINVCWMKDLMDKSVKVLSILNLPQVWADFFIEEHQLTESGCAVNSIIVETERRTIKVLY